MLGRWTIVRYIEKGGNGEVYEATDESGTRGALKLLSNADTGKVPYKRFAREVDVFKALGLRPGISCRSSMPTCPSSHRRVRGSGMSCHSQVRYGSTWRGIGVLGGRQRCERSLAYSPRCAMRRGSFTAIKPANLYWLDGPAVGDFGLVEMPDAQSLTENGRIPGAFGFIADELFRDPDDSGPPVDVYSLAKTLWVLLVEGADFPPQGPLRADEGPATLVRALTIERAEEVGPHRGGHNLARRASHDGATCRRSTLGLIGT